MDNTIVRFQVANGDTPAGKVADAELHFVGGDLEGLKLVGFAVWVRRDGNGHNVTFPSRGFNVHGERRTFALLRAVNDQAAQERLRDHVLQEYRTYEQELKQLSVE
ncbi:MAG: hypothetical protein JNM38_12085 [Acidobacteria bacterium]|nr:hypothetical protein [Acidobacteriota bacterium]